MSKQIADLRRSDDDASTPGLWERLSARLRATPDFLIVGAQKAGTSSLYAYLSEHPQVMPARTKEIHFFDYGYRNGLRWYRAHFPTRIRMRQRAGELGMRVVTGEATPYYLFHPHACERIARDLPDARIIVLLRDPAERAFSHYMHNKRAGWEPLSFSEALHRETERIRPAAERLLENPAAIEYAHAAYSYAARGHYLHQLLRYERAFGKDRVLVLCSEEFFSSLDLSYQTTLSFLGLVSAPIPDHRVHNRGHHEHADSPEIRELRAYFRPYNLQLFEHLGRELPWPSD